MTDASASTYELVITNSDFSLLLGHHQFTCHIEETQPDGTVIEGTPKVFGIEISVLQSRFAGDIEQWLTWVQTQMLSQHQARMAVHKEILQWKGRRVAIALPVPTPQGSRKLRRRRAHRASRARRLK